MEIKELQTDKYGAISNYYFISWECLSVLGNHFFHSNTCESNLLAQCWSCHLKGDFRRHHPLKLKQKCIDNDCRALFHPYKNITSFMFYNHFVIKSKKYKKVKCIRCACVYLYTPLFHMCQNKIRESLHDYFKSTVETKQIKELLSKTKLLIENQNVN